MDIVVGTVIAVALLAATNAFNVATREFDIVLYTLVKLSKRILYYSMRWNANGIYIACSNANASSSAISSMYIRFSCALASRYDLELTRALLSWDFRLRISRARSSDTKRFGF